ncbi:unnamed protein product [Caenorhabditis brenneri]
MFFDFFFNSTSRYNDTLPYLDPKGKDKLYIGRVLTDILFLCVYYYSFYVIMRRVFKLVRLTRFEVVFVKAAFPITFMCCTDFFFFWNLDFEILEKLFPGSNCQPYYIVQFHMLVVIYVACQQNPDYYLTPEKSTWSSKMNFFYLSIVMNICTYSEEVGECPAFITESLCAKAYDLNSWIKMTLVAFYVFLAEDGWTHMKANHFDVWSYDRIIGVVFKTESGWMEEPVGITS